MNWWFWASVVFVPFFALDTWYCYRKEPKFRAWWIPALSCSLWTAVLILEMVKR